MIGSTYPCPQIVSYRTSRYNPIMLNALRNTLQQLWHGVRLIGPGPSLRTAIYPLRLSWYQARFDLDDSGKAFTRSTPQALRHLLQGLMTKKTGDTSIESIGAVIATKRLPNGVELRCTNGLCTIEAITSRIMRVRVVREAAMPPYFSYATVLDPQDVPLDIQEEEKGLTISTPDLCCHVLRSPFGLRLSDARGRDVMGGSATIAWTQEGGQLQQRIPPEMQYYGLGERAVHFPSRGHHFQLTTCDP
ncbi:MAG TPA: DUF4968 domain-containing protein, partial [Caldilineae bacterium]|nr:DUF4968 domain-containing protein [Caldilineae bacterium]